MGSSASAFVDQAKVALEKGNAIMRRFGVAMPASLARLVWYVRRDGASDVDCEQLINGAFSVADHVDADFHFVPKMSHPDSLIELDVIAHFALGADEQSVAELEFSSQ